MYSIGGMFYQDSQDSFKIEREKKGVVVGGGCG